MSPARLESISDVLEPFNIDLRRRRDRYERFYASTYFQKIREGILYPPPKNAPELQYRALTAKPPYLNPKTGYMEYPVFSGRNDEWAIKGQSRPTEEYMRHLGREAKLNTKDRMIVIVAPSGAGKSTFLQIPQIELENYTDEANPPPIHGIVKCPINEDPNNILHGKLCPSCQEKSEEFIQHRSVGFDLGTPPHLDFQVQALNFSQKLGRGITRITSLMSKDQINKAILGSNRGILYFPELGQLPDDYLNTYSNLIRGRMWEVGDFVYHLDNTIIGEMLYDKWKEFEKNPANESLKQRMDVIYMTYPLNPKVELEILRKRIHTSPLEVLPHSSPRTEEFASEFATRSRYRKGTIPNAVVISGANKARLYSGEDAGVFTQQDRKKIENEGFDAREGLEGMSPPTLWDIYSKIIFEEVVAEEEAKKEGGHKKACVDFTAFKIETDKILATIIKDNLRKQSAEAGQAELKEVTEERDRWLQNTIEKAFQDDFSERANKQLELYLDACGWLLDPTQARVVRDPKDVEEDTRLMLEFENKVGFANSFQALESKLDAGEKSADNEQKKRQRFRSYVYKENGSILRKEKRKAQYTDFLNQIPGLENGLKDLLKGVGDVKDIIKAVRFKDGKPILLTLEQQEKFESMWERLLSDDFGFCQSCAQISIEHIGTKLRG